MDYSWWLQYLDIWLVVYLPLWKIWKSVGIIIPNIWKNKIHVPNHQPDIHGDTWIIYNTYVAGLRDDPEPGTWSSKNSHESGHQLQPKPPFFTPKQEIYRWWMLVTDPIISQYSSSDIPVNSTKCTHSWWLKQYIRPTGFQACSAQATTIAPASQRPVALTLKSQTWHVVASVVAKNIWKFIQ